MRSKLDPPRIIHFQVVLVTGVSVHLARPSFYDSRQRWMSTKTTITIDKLFAACISYLLMRHNKMLPGRYVDTINECHLLLEDIIRDQSSHPFDKYVQYTK